MTTHAGLTLDGGSKLFEFTIQVTGFNGGKQESAGELTGLMDAFFRKTYDFACCAGREFIIGG